MLIGIVTSIKPWKLLPFAKMLGRILGWGDNSTRTWREEMKIKIQKSIITSVGMNGINMGFLDFLFIHLKLTVLITTFALSLNLTLKA